MYCVERVAIIPSVVQTLTKKGFGVNVEEGAGREAKFSNDQYVNAGAKIVDKTNAFQSGKWFFFRVRFSFNEMCIVLDIVLKVRQPLDDEVRYFKENGTLISFLYPVQNKTLVDQLAKKHMTVFGEWGFNTFQI